MSCKHEQTSFGEDRAFFHCVAPHRCNPAAHGGVTYTETCLACGQQRQHADNGSHSERSDWHNVVTVTLGRDGMGPESDEADFEAWVAYVSRHFARHDAAVTVQSSAPSDALQQCWTVHGTLSTQTISDELCDVWEAFCATPDAWPERHR